MKIFLIVLGILSLDASSKAFWWNNDAAQEEHQHAQFAEEQLVQAQGHIETLDVVVLVLAVGVVVALGVGAAIGSKARKSAEGKHP